jgi:hypothetical protein
LLNRASREAELHLAPAFLFLSKTSANSFLSPIQATRAAPSHPALQISCFSLSPR